MGEAGPWCPQQAGPGEVLTKVSSLNLHVLCSLSPHSPLLLSLHILSVTNATCADVMPGIQVSGLGDHLAKKEAFPSSRRTP